MAESCSVFYKQQMTEYCSVFYKQQMTEFCSVFYKEQMTESCSVFYEQQMTESCSVFYKQQMTVFFWRIDTIILFSIFDVQDNLERGEAPPICLQYLLTICERFEWKVIWVLK